ncbi:FAD-dependent oxidoreductase [Paenibacillus apiarius]|uniref:FAD-dependent oxidoreductase n=1 Tax=Paenibacillus apiarius TaxID=46240 RepID=A0ABT4DS12_9BACL|nr:FAD-dependent oxidoreductase [Paenibacillus apiarius]MBN3524627.1 FAD-dependent oxidoreductase [Paenibacillus apiarius]MCY9514275.1 FAD-dependent oxidoreductase [Paenibacillus apiarius]MCY9520142.1 FAD-dependent oxidoreductase [Paenibacillus apiarius]MCY9550149.1 FAD-dependent oxidoreductase [Paenibacillus apiarius]MCY9560240.1 FAD-dependent oxidoreductase [Paenibacillus apiarius]
MTQQKSEWKADLVIIGGGVGGCAAALAACRLGKTVLLTEETARIGGQLTSQLVPPDEHPWIEQFGCTETYRQFRNAIRRYYRDHLPLNAKARSNQRLNPGNGNVSRLCHDPRIALHVLETMLFPYVHSGLLTIRTECRAVSAEVEGDRIRAVTVRDAAGNAYACTAPYFLDATECGDLLALSGTEYITGAESQRDTGEPHAVPGAAEPQNMQGITYCFAVDYEAGEDHTIAKPERYDFWRQYKPSFWPDRLLSWTGVKPSTLEPVKYSLFREQGSFPLFHYRQITDPALYDQAADAVPRAVTVVNWPQNDYWLGSIIDVSEAEKERNLYDAKQLSLSLLYWMQTEAPRHDGGCGYPGLRVRHDVAGTADGMAMYPYVRESRRIQAEFTVLEQHISTDFRQGKPAETFPDSVGIGCYRIDLHPSTGGNNYIDISSLPFQIPLGSLLPVRMDNLIPACKNIGTTHITNGCYRLHPAEWNIGESAGALVAYALNKDIAPRAVRSEQQHLEAYQRLLQQIGIELQWPSTRPV